MTLDMEKEISMQELLIKGFQKENERLLIEKKNLKKENEDLRKQFYKKH